ncbi:peptide chain release factor N(5)-glutamine methyltransferase [Chromatiaceae bacterium AAb-1]|nr:peptide chain release factor N(5)-glutamine methyltransferase [Chromatiaceae bacterium AAb-1]
MPASDIRSWLNKATLQLAAVSDVPDIEARLCLTSVLNVSNSYLYSYSEQLLTGEQLAALDTIVQRRQHGEPLAYILGKWSFWNIELDVAPSTLIPRPDTEILVERVLNLPLPEQATVLDLGTGTGAIALALACNRPAWQVTAVDFIADAVALAQRNARQLQAANCTVLQSNWFSALAAKRFDVIVSNPPYIEEQDPHLAALRFEPVSALVAAEQGLADLQLICQQAPAYLNAAGWLWLEHGYNQADAVRQLLAKTGFINIGSMRDYGGNWRISGGQLPC